MFALPAPTTNVVPWAPIWANFLALAGGSVSTIGSVENFGAQPGNPSFDSGPAFNKAIAAAAAKGGGVIYASGSYQINTQIVIGNGTDTTNSTYSGVCLIGQSQGAGADEITGEAGPSELTWGGATNTPMILINGPIGGIQIANLFLNCNGVTGSTAIDSNHMFGSSFYNLIAQQYGGPAYIVRSRGTVALVGATRNTFYNISTSSPITGSGAIGLQLGLLSAASVSVRDVLRQMFVNCLFTADGGTGGIVPAMKVGYADHSCFIQTIFSGEGGANYNGLQVVVPGSVTTFPSNIFFYGCPVINGVSVSGSWTGTTGLGFYPYPTADAEPVPPNTTPGLFYGVTDTNIQFGGAAAYNLQAVVTGFSYTIPNNQPILFLNPNANPIATGTVTMPATPIDNEEVNIATSKTITSLTVSPNAGQTIINAPTTLATGTGCRFRYVASSTTWYREQ
jgi:hypothetical protein